MGEDTRESESVVRRDTTEEQESRGTQTKGGGEVIGEEINVIIWKAFYIQKIRKKYEKGVAIPNQLSVTEGWFPNQEVESLRANLT